MNPRPHERARRKRAPRDQQPQPQQRRRQQERRARHFQRRLVADEIGEGQRKQKRSHHLGNAVDAVGRTLQLALLIRRNELRRQCLDRRARHAPQRHHGDAEPEQRPGRGGAINEKAERAAGEPEQQRPAFAETLDDRADARALHHHGADADQRQRQADRRRVPTVSVGGVEHEGGRQHHMRDLPEEIRQRQPGENRGWSATDAARRAGWRSSSGTARAAPAAATPGGSASRKACSQSSDPPRSRTAGADPCRRAGRRWPDRE